MSGAPIVIVGGGQAADEAALQLRNNGATGPITIVCEEAYLPYRRPPLSKTVLAEGADPAGLLLRTADTYARLGITVLTGRRATHIDRARNTVALDDGSALPYAQAILAMGGTARRLAIPGGDLAGIHYLRGVRDALALRAELRAGRHVLIIGGGYVGLEVASVAVRQGLRVTVLEAAPRLLARVAPPEISTFYEQVHRDEGVDIHLGLSASGLLPDSSGARVGAVQCGHAVFAADLVVVGIGLAPNTALAEHAGLVIDDGILVDPACRTSDPDIFAIGDCSAHAAHDFLGTRVRLESVANAVEQARAAAAAICGKPIPRPAPPWFWSEQYDLNLQMVGVAAGYDRCILRGATQTRSFSAFYLLDGGVKAGISINRNADFLAARRMVAQRLHPVPALLSDPSVSLKSLL
jgi:3-phenylpropionate/trans-cinnamate dioxygenase ferredoxin reductase subunit